MTDCDSSRLFVCDVLPTTRWRAFARQMIVGAALAAGVLAVAVGTATATPWLALAAGLALIALVLVGTAGNPMLEFYREYECAGGSWSPAESVGSTRFALLALPVCAVLVTTPSPVVAATAIYIGLITFIGTGLRGFRRPMAGVVAEFVNLLFVYLGYPDRRYSGVAGNAGLWFPASSVKWRTLKAGAHLAPIYACLAVGMFRWLLSRSSEGAADILFVFPAFLLMLSPHLLLFASELRPLAIYLRSRNGATGLWNEWERAVEIVANSKHVEGDFALADHFFIGWYVPSRASWNHPFHYVGRFDLPCRVPVLLHRSIIFSHGHLLGSTQTGKTSIGLTTLLIQILRGWNVRRLDYFGRPVLDGHGKQVWSRSKPLPMLIIDMKGDLALFNTVREECVRLGRTFKFFTLSGGSATSYFNALPNLGIDSRNVAEFCELVLNALSLFHGLSYGRSYYSKQSRDLLLKTLKAAARKPASWEELHDLLLSEIDPKKHKDVFELVSSIFALAQYPVLGPAPAGVDVIHMPEVIEECQVVYFNLPARLSAISARDVGKLALFAFVTAAADWNDRNEERRCVIFLDEAQIICSSNLATLFQQCSGAKTSILVSNQARSDLNVPDAPTLGETVRVNTRFKQMFTVADPEEAEDLIKMSGDRVGILRAYMKGTDGMGRSTSGVTTKQTLYPVLTQNDINAVNNDPNGSLLHVTTDAGFTTLNGIPRHIQTPYPLDAVEYRRRMHTPWPEAPAPVPTPTGSSQTVVNTLEPEDVQQQAEQDYSQLMEFFRQTAKRAGRTTMRDWTDVDD